MRQRIQLSRCPGRDHPAFQRRPGSRWIVLQHGEEAANKVHPRAPGRPGLPGEQLVEPPHALSRRASDPVPDQAAGKIYAAGVLVVHAAPEDGSDVVDLQLHPCEPLKQAVPSLRRKVHAPRQVVVGAAQFDGVLLARLVQLEPRVFPHRLVQPVAGGAGGVLLDHQ